MNKLARDIANTPALMNAPIGRQGNDDLLNAKSPSAAIENLKEELKNNGLANTKGTGDIGADLGTTSLDLESATAVTDETAELASAPIDETYDLSGSEISEKKDVSIFQILSHRYQQTGIKRLRAPKVKD